VEKVGIRIFYKNSFLKDRIIILKMITCSLMGGLGNQLFQIFATISYAIKCNNEFKFINIKTLGGNVSTLRYTFWDSFLISLKPFLINFFPELAIIRESSFEFKELPISLLKNRNVCIHGYFQSYKYFNEKFSLIYDLLDIDRRKKEVIKKLNETFKESLSNSISMHFRLGDYKKIKVSEKHPILPSNYYIKSLKYILESETETENNNISKKVIYFCEKEDIQIVEETIHQCKILFPYIEFQIFSHFEEDWKQMLIMSECKHHIIANSSFSWWGAYIGFENLKKQNNIKNKIICYPSLWFAPSASENTKDLFPTEWTKIDIN
jgi:hypothetical protein